MTDWTLVLGIIGLIVTLISIGSKIGAKIGGVQTSVDDLKATVGTLSTGVDALRNDFAEMRRDHAVLEQRVSHMETKQ